MRLICPNCAAQYEVPADVIPEEGRDVQCSNCSHTWFQPHPSRDTGLRDETDLEEPEPDEADDADGPDEIPTARAESTPRPAPAARARALPDEVASVLREEAERERRARESERGSVEIQPDLGLEPAPAKAAPKPQPATAKPVASSSRKQALPDVEEITSTLRPMPDRRDLDRQPERDRADELTLDPPRSGFGRGFRWAVILSVLAAALYVLAPRISETLPQADAVLRPYTEAVDAGRVWLAEQAATVVAKLDAMSSEAREQQ